MQLIQKSLLVVTVANALGIVASASETQTKSLRYTIEEGILQNNTSIGVTFSGGGFRAHAVHTGVIAGLLGRMGDVDPQKGLGKLFSRVDSIGSNSGGSWFSSQILFSKNFATLVSDIGRESLSGPLPGQTLYNTKWMQPFLKDIKKLSVGSKRASQLSAREFSIIETFKEIISLIFKALEILNEWWLLLKVFVFERSLSWNELIKHLIQVPGDIDASQTLDSSNANSWANGKTWAVAGALVTPWNKNRAFGHHYTDCTIDPSSQRFTPASIVYNMRRKLPYQQGPYTWPISFSSVLGKTDVKPPVAFIHGEEDLYTSYSTVSVPLVPLTFGLLGKEMSRVEGASPVFENSPLLTKSSKVSIGDAVSTSSSFLGRVVSLVSLLPKVVTHRVFSSSAFKQYILDLPLYISASEPNPANTFRIGEKLAKSIPRETPCNQMLEEVSNGRLLTVADGGYVDNSAVAQLMADPSKNEFVLFQNNDQEGYSDIISLFQPETHVEEKFDTTSRIPVFAEKETWALEAVSSFPKLVTTPGAKHLLNIQYGTLEGTTIDQPLFGVKGGRKIKLHCVFVHSTVNIGEAQWSKFPALVGEVSATIRLAENNNAAQLITKWISTFH